MDKILLIFCALSVTHFSTSSRVLSHPNCKIQRQHEGQYYRHLLRRDQKDPNMCVSAHILKVPGFWNIFSHDVEVKKSWKCSFPVDIMTENIIEDAALYKDNAIFQNRRQGVKEWVSNETLWSTIVLGACKELSEERDGEFVQELRNLHLLEALKDFVDHINYFYQVASIMKAAGEEVIVLSPNSSAIHDIDKLDPIMLVGYSERFEDNQNTSLWQACVDRHTHTNPHHQAHCMWRDCCRCGKPSTNNTKVCMGCDNVRSIALREMVCDKVSRRLQKDLGGEVVDAMWDADMNFFQGLPAEWLDKAAELMQRLKRWSHASGKVNVSMSDLESAFEFEQ